MSDTRYEHLKYDKGKMYVGKVDTAKAMGVGEHDYWGRVDHIIQEYARLHPQEVSEALDYCRWQRDNAYNDFGVNVEDSNSTMRLGIGLPNGLLIALMTFDPEFLENDGNKLSKFRKRFPGFNTSKKT